LPNGRFALPNAGSGAPTTHILKVPDRDHPKDAIYECEALNLSCSLGFNTAAAEVLNIDGIDALLVTRFDRAHNEAGEVIRLHQEDFAQALGLPPSLKYERYGQPGRRFDADAIRGVLDETDEPVKERDNFIGATFFDLFAGNVDAHAKNHGLFHLAHGGCRTTPRYDIMPTRLDPDLTDELPFTIGAAKRLSEITVDDVDAFLGKLGIAGAAAKKRVRTRHANFVAQRLADQLEELSDKRLKVFADLIAANIRNLMPVLGLNVPKAARERDAFVARGGGWLGS
jgi:serine/threonine-protein kinase HipA